MTTDKCLYCGGELNTARACVNPDCESKKLRAYPMPDATSRHTWTACIPPCQQLTDLAARLDAAEKRITELELASPCPMLKSICEDWEYTGKLDGTERIKIPISQPKFGPVLNNPKPQSDREIVERYMQGIRRKIPFVFVYEVYL